MNRNEMLDIVRDEILAAKMLADIRRRMRKDFEECRYFVILHRGEICAEDITQWFLDRSFIPFNQYHTHIPRQGPLPEDFAQTTYKVSWIKNGTAVTATTLRTEYDCEPSVFDMHTDDPATAIEFKMRFYEGR